MRSQTLKIACAVATLAIGTCSLGHAQSPSAGSPAGQTERSWHSPSLRSETVVGPNGAVTTGTALLANDKWGIGNTKRVEKVTDGVYAMRGWGIASSFAIEAPAGWIIIDTGDHTQAAAEMRATARADARPQGEGRGHPADPLALRATAPVHGWTLARRSGDTSTWIATATLRPASAC